MCKHYGTPLSEEHRHHIPSPQHDNCVLCISETGPMTQESIAPFLGITKERVSQIEKVALRKLENALAMDSSELAPEPGYSFVMGNIWSHGKMASSLFHGYLDKSVPYWRPRKCLQQKTQH